jgi:NDP-sugar pyrophosphorylase family protein
VRLIGVVPAAGLATRLQPLPCSKEVLPVDGRPVLAHLVERMRAAGPDEIRVVTRPEKEDVTALARELHCDVVLGTPATAADSVALGARALADDDVVLIGFPDTVWGPADGFARLLAALGPDDDVALGLFPATGTEQASRSDVAVLDESGRVEEIQVKPAEPASALIWGIAAARPPALDGLTGREHVGDLFAEHAQAGRVAGVLLEGAFLDVGTPESLRAAAR